MVQGLLDFFTGSGDYADPTKIDPRTGVPMADVRQAAWNSIGNMGAILLAAGQNMAPQQRAAYLSQLGQAAGGFNTDLYNASQRRLMQAQYQQRMEEMQDDARIREDLKDPAAFQQKYGFNPAGLGVSDVRQAIRTIRTRDPNEAVLRELSIKEKQRTLGQPEVKEIAGGLATYNDQTKKWEWTLPPKPTGGLEGEDNALIMQGAQNPEIAKTPQYAAAFVRRYGPETVIRNGEVVQIIKPIPPGIPRPAGFDAAAAAAPSADGAPQAQGGGEARTVTTPGGGSVTVTSTQPKALSAAEVQLRADAETTLAGLREAQSALADANKYSKSAYSGPLASQRGAIAGVTGMNPDAAVATREFNAIMTGQALNQLRAIFGGNPTEGERKILLDMQASAQMSQPEREALLKRAQRAVDARISQTESRLQSIVRGDYTQVQRGYTPPAAPSAPALPPGFEVLP